MGWEWIDLAQDRDKRRALLKAGMNRLVPKIIDSFFTI
jgi:hypothetical protein